MTEIEAQLKIDGNSDAIDLPFIQAVLDLMSLMSEDSSVKAFSPTTPVLFPQPPVSPKSLT